jgi:excinuclease UvrABC nuclease subunit
MYVGRTNSLRRRFNEYLNERKRETGRPKIYRLLNMYEPLAKVSAELIFLKKISLIGAPVLR